MILFFMNMTIRGFLHACATQHTCCKQPRYHEQQRQWCSSNLKTRRRKRHKQAAAEWSHDPKSLTKLRPDFTSQLDTSWLKDEAPWNMLFCEYQSVEVMVVPPKMIMWDLCFIVRSLFHCLLFTPRKTLTKNCPDETSQLETSWLKDVAPLNILSCGHQSVEAVVVPPYCSKSSLSMTRVMMIKILGSRKEWWCETCAWW